MRPLFTERLVLQGPSSSSSSSYAVIRKLHACIAEWQAVEPRVRKTFLPIFWVEEKSQATPDQCSAFKKQVSQTAFNHEPGSLL